VTASPRTRSIENHRMIPLTKLSNQSFVLNAELIKFVESTPDTMITLTTGDRMIVKESADEVIRRVIDYGRLLRRLIEPS
jgi:flagellar protein FlbD